MQHPLQLVDQLARLEGLGKVAVETLAVPVYGGWEFNLGHGIAGGRLINLREHGRAAADLAVASLRSGSFGKDRLKPSPNQYMFDFVQLKRFKIGVEDLPAGSSLVNRPATFMSVYGFRAMVLLCAGLFLLVLVILGKLMLGRNAVRASEARYRGMIEAFDGFMLRCVMSVIMESLETVPEGFSTAVLKIWYQWPSFGLWSSHCTLLPLKASPFLHQGQVEDKS